MKKFLLNIAAAALAVTLFNAPMAASAETVTKTGTFSGQSDHITTGGVTVVKTENGRAIVILDSDFSLDGAPDPRVGLGRDGEYIDATDLGILGHNTGMQVFIVPPHVNVSDFNEVYIWCKQFTVSLGVASIN